MQDGVGRHLHRRHRHRGGRPTSPRTRSPTTRRRTRRTASRSSTWRAISGNEKLFKLDLDDGKKTQLTFGTHDDAAARSSSTPTRSSSRRRRPIPNKPIEPEVARNGQHLQPLDAQPEDRRAEAVHRRRRRQLLAGRAARRQSTTKIAFVTYYKGDYELHTLERKEAIVTAATARLRRARARSSTSRRRSATRSSPRTRRRRARGTRCSSTAARRSTSA